MDSARLEQSEVAQSVAPSEIRVPELDGLRAIAIWAVLSAHVVFAYPPPEGALSWLPAGVASMLGHGWLGVDFFFVLSGFLITGILLDTKNRPNYYRRFYGRRALRILPVYFASIGVFWFFYPDSGKYFLISSLFLANFSNVLSVPAPHGPSVLWSLAVEEHFYLAWPWLVRWTSRRGLAIAAGAIVVVSPLLRGFATAGGVPVDAIVYQLSIFRFDGLALGALLALWMRSETFTRGRSIQMVWFLLAGEVVLTAATAPFGGMGRATPVGVAIRYTQAQWLFAALMLAVLVNLGAPATAVFRSRFMTLSGELSYCIYLIHLALADGYMAAVRPRVEPLLQARFGPDVTMAARVGMILAVTFGIALLSRTFLERPVLKLKRHLA